MMLWTTRDGRTIDITQMTDRHLTNTIAYMKRRVKDAYENENAAWRTLMSLQGEMAQYYVEQDIIRLGESCADAEHILGELKNELARREMTNAG